MENLTRIGRIFYGVAITEAGLQTIYYQDFPYTLLPEHSWIPGLVIFAYFFGVLLVLAGGCIVFDKKGRPVSLLLGGVLLLIFCFWHIPYQFLVSPNYTHFGDWENAAKELGLASGALVVAGCFSEPNGNSTDRFLKRLIPLGAILFSPTMISFGIDHFLFAKEASALVPAWIPGHLFWIYFGGVALIGSGVGIILKIKTRLIATLLGSMILSWFIILHIPRIVVAPAPDLGDEVASAFIALAYSGIAFVIAGLARKGA